MDRYPSELVHTWKSPVSSYFRTYNAIGQSVTDKIFQSGAETMTNRLDHYVSGKCKCQQGNKPSNRRDVQSELKRLRDQQSVMERKLGRLQRQQRILRRTSQELSMEIKGLKQKDHQSSRHSEETRHHGVLNEVGEIWRDGIRLWIKGVLR